MRIHEALVAIATQRQALHAREVLLLVEAEDVELWRHFGCATFFEYLERYCDLQPRTAREYIRVARALKHLPLMRGQLAGRNIQYSTARELTRVAAPDTEAEWLAHTAGMSPREIEREVANREKGDRPSDPANPDKLVKLVLEVRQSTYAQYVERRTSYASDFGERLTDDDLMLALCRDDVSSSNAAPYQLAITTCRACAKSFQLGGGREIEISPALLATAQCDGRHLGDLESDAPQRTKSIVSPRKRLQVMARDGFTCCVPGCRSQRHLDVHHLEFQMHGGSNKTSNLITLCAGHHRQLHDGRLAISGKAPHGLTFTFAKGGPVGRADYGPVGRDVARAELLRAASSIDGEEIRPSGPR